MDRVCVRPSGGGIGCCGRVFALEMGFHVALLGKASMADRTGEGALFGVLASVVAEGGRVECFEVAAWVRAGDGGGVGLCGTLARASLLLDLFLVALVVPLTPPSGQLLGLFLFELGSLLFCSLGSSQILLSRDRDRVEQRVLLRIQRSKDGSSRKHVSRTWWWCVR